MSVETGETDGETTGDGIVVAYVDDYEELCSLTAEGLEEANDRLEVTTITDPGSVTGRLEEFDCIVSDYEMPETDGLELLRQVRVLDDDVPFILFTGEGSEGVASDAISLGVTDYLTKRGGPERFTRLAHRIESVVDARRAAAEVESTRAQANEVIERERAKFRALIEHSPAVTVVLDAAGEFQYCSPSLEDVTGYKPRELRGDVAFDYIHENDRERAVREFERCLENPEYMPTIRYRFRDASGEWRHMESKGVNRLEDPAVGGFIVNTRDVTDEVRNEERMRREQNISERILEVSPAPMLVVGEDGQILRANRRAGEVFGADSRELVGWSVAEPDVEISTPDDDGVPPRELFAENVVGDGQTRNDVEYHVETSSGEYRIVISAAPLTGTDRDAAVVSIDEYEEL